LQLLQYSNDNVEHGTILPFALYKNRKILIHRNEDECKIPKIKDKVIVRIVKIIFQINLLFIFKILPLRRHLNTQKEINIYHHVINI
jgi:hypothetical protein